jgi:peptidoglycan/LPS O-acetylase OafA/YrhL
MNLPARMDAVTGLRALAAFSVLLFHLQLAGLVPPGTGTGRPILGSCFLGVDLFFLLSGFVLMHAHQADFATLQPRGVLRFYGLRLARIYPVHLTILLVVVAAFVAQTLLSPGGALAIKSQDRFPIDGLVRHFLLLGWSSATWNPPAWSLSAEWVAYLLFPAIAAAALRLALSSYVLLLGALAAGLGIVYAEVWRYDLDQHGLVRVAFEFPAGCLLYRLAPHLPRRTAMAIFLGCLGLVAALAGTRWAQLAILPMLASAILVCATANPVSRPLTARWIVWLGEISYPIYMVHVLVLGFVARAVHAVPGLSGGLSLLPMLLGIAATVGTAAALHYAVERPARARLRLIIDGEPRLPSLVPGLLRLGVAARPEPAERP